MVQVAEAALAGGAEWLAVATADEAAELRGAGIDARLLVMGALTAGELRCRSRPTRTWWPGPRRSPRRPPRVHVKLDTGMSRLGTKDRELALRLAARPNPVGLMTHFRDGRRARRRPLRCPDRGVPRVRGRGGRDDLIVHAANSAAALRDPASHFDMVRCGIAVYGLDPFGEDPGAHGLEPALSLHSWVASIRRLEPGESAGYGRRWRAEEPTWLATVPIGYGDGWRRALTNNADVLIRGRRHPLVGAVSMDNVTVALGRDTDVELGDEVVLIGAPGRRADPRRGGGAAARHDQLRGDDRAAAAGEARARPVSRSWIVGGALRDELLGREVTDIDIAVEGDPETAARASSPRSSAARSSGSRRRSARGGSSTASAAASTTSRRSRERASRRTCGSATSR